MSRRTITQLHAFVASPGDVAEERALLEEIVRELNLTWSQHLGIRLELIRWETHAMPGMGADAQDVINQQIHDDYDIFIGILWARFGTSTNRAESGTAEEFDRAYRRFQDNPDQIRIMFYFKDAPISPSQIDPDQLAAVAKFRNKLGEQGGLYFKFSNRDEFEGFLRMHLSRQIQEWQKTWGLERLAAASESDATPAESREPIASAEGGEVEIVSIDAEVEEEGLLDLAETAQEQFKVLIEVLSRILADIHTLTTKFEERSAEQKAVNRMGDVPDFKQLKRVGNRLADDLNHFADRVETEIPILTNSYSTAVNAIAGMASLSADFEDEGTRIIKNNMGLIDQLRSLLQTVHDGTVDMKETLKGFARFTTSLNRAKKRSVGVLSELERETASLIQLAREAQKTLQSLLDE